MNYDPIGRIIYLMNYDLSKTSEENLVEQSQPTQYSQLQDWIKIPYDTLKKYVDTAVDDLDGFVNTDNLQSLLTIYQKLSGKKKVYDHEPALKTFFDLYKEDENGNNIVDDIKSVGTKTLGSDGDKIKNDLINYFTPFLSTNYTYEGVKFPIKGVTSKEESSTTVEKQEKEAYEVMMELEKEKIKKSISPNHCKSCMFSKTGQFWKEVEEYSKSKRNSELNFIFGGEGYGTPQEYAERANNIICINHEFLDNPFGSKKWCDKGFGIYSTMTKEYGCKDIDDCRKKGKELIDYLDTKPLWDNENMGSFLQNAAIITGILGMIPSPMSPVFLGASLAAELADATRYVMNGDYYTATIFGLLAILPASELFKLFQKTRVMKQLGKEGIEILIKNAKNGKATSKELKMLTKISEELGTNADFIKKLVKANFVRTITKNLGKQSTRRVAQFYYMLHKLKIINIFKFTFMIAGIPITADRLYVYINRDLIQNSNALTIREKSDLIQMVRSVQKLIKGNEDQIPTEVSEQLEDPLMAEKTQEKFNEIFKMTEEEKAQTEQNLKMIIEEYRSKSSLDNK